MTDDIPFDLSQVAEYLSGTCSPAERAEIDRWVQADPARIEQLDRLRTLWTIPRRHELRPQLDRAAILDVVHSRIADHRGGQTSASRRAPVMRARGFSRGIVITLSAVFIVAAGVLIARPWQVGQSSPRTQRYETHAGQRSTVQLAGNSTMLLGPSTVATVTSAGIEVLGEAYFTVAPHSTQPFVVQTRTAIVRVLGTTFAVRQYPGEAKSRVVVEDGKVAVQTRHGRGTNATSAVLTTRMLAQIADSGVIVSSNIATSDLTSWTHGLLVFNRTALRDVVAELVRAYGVDIQVADTALASRVMHIDVSVSDDPLSKVLEQICKVTDAHYTRIGQAYVLSPGHMATQTPPLVPQHHQFPQPEQQYGR